MSLYATLIRALAAVPGSTCRSLRGFLGRREATVKRAGGGQGRMFQVASALRKGVETVEDDQLYLTDLIYTGELINDRQGHHPLGQRRPFLALS